MIALEKGGVVARHTTMPARTQRTPFGDVTLSSRWKRDRYYLTAKGPRGALLWMFPGRGSNLRPHGQSYRVDFVPASKPVTVERELRRICAKWQAAWNERLNEEPADSEEAGEDRVGTLGALFDHLSSERERRLKANTHQADLHDLGLWETELGRDRPLTQVTDRLIQTAFDALLARMKPSSANRALGTLKTYLNWAEHRGLLLGAPHRNVRQARVPRSHRSIQWWTRDEVTLALRCAREVDEEVRQASNRNQDTNPARNAARGLDRARLDDYATAELLVGMGCYLGLRLEEIVMQRWQDIDLDAVNPATGVAAPVCHVVAHSDWEPKDKESRTIPINRELAAILTRHRRPEGFLLAPRVSRRKRGGKRRVYRYDPRKVWQRVIKRVLAAGGRRITPYGMRHTFASNLLIAGVSDTKVARWLGHSDTRMVHRHYGHLLAYDDDINR